MSEKINRRTFLNRMAGAGVLVATASLPSFGAEKKDADAQQDAKNAGQELFPRRGRFERLSINVVTVNIGLEEPFSVLHISDTHLTAAYPHESEKKQTLCRRRSETFGGMQEEALRDSLEWAKMHTDYVLHTGDLIDWQSEANFDLVRKYFGQDMACCLGNHEYSPDMWLSEVKEYHEEGYKELSRELLEKNLPYELKFSSQVVKGVNFIMMEDSYAYVTEEQVRMFKEEVRKGLPIVLCMHVPFTTPDIWRASRHYWERDDSKLRFTDAAIPRPSGDWRIQQEDKVTREFIAYLKQEPLLKAILAGHDHITIQDRFSPTAMEYVVGGNFLFCGQEVLFV
jgi:predicted MPP superfamily phosphohydrolase